MAADMALRSLYLPAGSTINHTAATEKVRRLCREAIVDDLRVLLDFGWIEDEVPYSDEALAARAETLRRTAERELLLLFDQFTRSLGRRDVTLHRFDSGDEPGIDAYETGGGLSYGGDGPTDACDD